MKIKRFLIGTILATFLAWVGLVAILNYVFPHKGNQLVLVLILFFISFFVAVVGLATLIGFVVRRISQRKKIAEKQLKVAFRQAILLGLVFNTVLIIQSQRLLTWWLAVILMIIAGLIEWLFSKK